MEGLFSQDGQDDLELIGQRADQRHHQQRSKQPRGPSNVAKAFEQLPRRVNRLAGRTEKLGLHRGKRDDERYERPRVEEEAGADPDADDEHTRQRRSDRARGVDHRAVQRDGVGY